MSKAVVLGLGIACLVALAGVARAEDLQRQKAAVVKLTSQADGKTRIGTGFIVKVEPDAVYIVTASHVVEGDPAPLVEFFTGRNRRVQAEIVKLEGGDPKGVGLIAVRGRDRLPANLGALAFETDADLEGADEVVTIGFGQGQGDWAVLKGQVVSVDGRDVKIDGRIEEGNSGGPVLKEGRVVGLITSSQRGLGLATPAQFVKFVLKSWGVDPARVAAPSPAVPGAQAPQTEHVEAAARSAPTPGSPAARSDDIVQRYDETARAAIDRMNRTAPPSAPPAAASGQLTWRDHALRFVGTLVEGVSPSVRAQVFELGSDKLIGTYEVPVVPDLTLAPAVVVFMLTFDIPGDSTTPQPHVHISYLHFRIQSETAAVLVQNCDQTGSCYPAQGTVALE
jgi:hypothetical protein